MADVGRVEDRGSARPCRPAPCDREDTRAEPRLRLPGVGRVPARRGLNTGGEVDTEVTVTVDDNVALVRRFYEEVYNRGNVAFADEAHAAGYRYHDTTNP